MQINAGNTLTVGNGGTAGTLDADAAVNGALVFNRSDDVTFGGDIAGTGVLTKSGAGKLVYDGDGSLFQGVTSVSSGSLVVGGAAGSTARLGGAVQVGAGASLGGHGTLDGSVNMMGGSTLSPGNSIGTLTIGGDLVSIILLASAALAAIALGGMLQRHADAGDAARRDAGWQREAAATALLLDEAGDCPQRWLWELDAEGLLVDVVLVGVAATRRSTSPEAFST